MSEQVNPPSKQLTPALPLQNSQYTEKDSLLTVQDVAKLLRVRPDTVRRWSNQGILKPYRLGSRGDRRFIRSEITGDLLTIREVSKLLAVHPNTIRRWSDQGVLVTYRFGRRGDRRFPRADIMDALARFIG